MTIYEAIHNYRYDAGLSQLELSRRSGVPQRTISFWESGRGDPSVNDCIRLANGIGITLSELVRGVDLAEEGSKKKRRDDHERTQGI